MTSGEKRKGPGRPVGTTRLKREVLLCVRLTAAERDKAKHIGQGNVSQGLRAALKDYRGTNQ